MINVPTPHNSANLGDIAKTVLMPGDPLRAKYIADKYLKDVELYNNVRGMLGFTGTYKDVKISVQGSGMGIPSMGIYSKELFDGYNVENIIRVGSVGALSDDVKLRDIIVANEVVTDSNYLNTFENCNNINPVCSEKLLNKLKEIIVNNNETTVKIGKVFTSDKFYNSNENLIKEKNTGALGVEMETLALYTNAKISNKNAIAMFTVSDAPLRGESLSADDRQNTFDEMIKIALELAVSL